MLYCARMRNPINRGRLTLCAAAALASILSGCYPPQVQYPYTRLVTNRRAMLAEHLIRLLPEEQQLQPAAQQEASWLSDTAYKAAAGISRVNGSHFPGWSGNALINSRLQDRGLCWHYQHDLYRELRRRPLTYFRIGCCVRDKNKASEHNCVYLAPANADWPHAWVLDAWMWNGRLKVNQASELDPDDWEDLPSICYNLEQYYPVGHTLPMEHWAVIRTSTGKYDVNTTPEARTSPQYKRMQDNILQGKKEHPHSPTNY